MKKLTEQKIDKFLQDHHLGILSTINKDGSPDAAAIYFLKEKDTIYFLSSKETAKSHNIELNPKVTLTVTEEKRGICFQAKGEAKIKKGYITTIVPKMAKKLNVKDKIVSTLPLLKHRGEHVVIEIKLDKIRMRTYTDKELIEEELSYN